MDEDLSGSGRADRSIGSDERPHHRIRHITGIRIHQLTLPQSLSVATKLSTETPIHEEVEGYTLPGPSRLSSSPETSSILASSAGPGSRRARRESTSTLLPRSPSTSASPLSPVGSSFRNSHRTRSQTLAGEALEHGSSAHEPPLTEEETVSGRALARCFIALKPLDQVGVNGIESPTRPPPRRAESQDSIRLRQNSGSDSPRLSAGRRFGTADNHVANGIRQRADSSPGGSPTKFHGQLPSSPTRSSMKRATILAPRHSVPFYVSPIHRPSIYPRFLSLSPEDDFASWLSTEQAAQTAFELDIWYEDIDGIPKWCRSEELSRCVHLDQLRRRGVNHVVSPNTLEFMFAGDPKSVYYLSLEHDEAGVGKSTESDGESSLSHRPRGNRSAMPFRRRGLNVGTLLELINLQSVLVETEREIARVQGAIDSLLRQDIDWRAIRRDVKQREARCTWLEKATAHVDKVLRETQAHITLRDQANDQRRAELRQAHEQADLVLGQCEEHRQALDTVESERISIIPLIHHYRMNHAQTLDSVFPIQSLHPQSLLYTILDVPLPIPSNPKDPAPPISIPASILPTGYKVDERSTAAALGYAAMLVQILGHLGGSTAGLPYPITCAGSRSLVKDVISIMQGPRSFPLYTKGVERYRFEYAVHMLNQDIEILMQEANARPLDARQTLPNLKTLLLTLSSPVSHSHQSLASLGSKTAINSRTSSRQTSYTFHDRAGFGSPGDSTNGRDSPVSSRMGTGVLNSSPLSRVHERKSSLRPIKIARSLDDAMEEQLGDADSDGGGEHEKRSGRNTIHNIANRTIDA